MLLQTGKILNKSEKTKLGNVRVLEKEIETQDEELMKRKNHSNSE